MNLNLQLVLLKYFLPAVPFTFRVSEGSFCYALQFDRDNRAE